MHTCHAAPPSPRNLATGSWRAGLGRVLLTRARAARGRAGQDRARTLLFRRSKAQANVMNYVEVYLSTTESRGAQSTGPFVRPLRRY